MSLLANFFKKAVRLTQPHLSKVDGFERWNQVHWLQDPTFRPPIRPFDPSEVAEKKRELSMKNGSSDGNKRAKEGRFHFDERRPFRILCLDGGGIRGMLTCKILERIVEHQPNFMEEVDFICGTSAGGLLTLLLGAGYSPKECSDLYKFAIPHIFGFDPWRRLNPFVSKFDDKAKEEICKAYLGDRTMMDLDKIVAAISFRLDGRKSKTHSFFNKDGWRPAVFSNMPRGAGLVEPDADLMAWEAAMRTSAAPTFFPIHHGYTDGAMAANNPSLIGCAKAMAHYRNVTQNNIVVLSIGSGHYPRHAKMIEAASKFQRKTMMNGSEAIIDAPLDVNTVLDKADWGIKQWIPFLLDILMDGDSVTTEMVMHYMLSNRGLYHRLDPRLPKQVELDAVEKVDELIEFAKHLDMTQTLKFVDEKFSHDEFDSVVDNESYNSLDSATNYHDAWNIVTKKIKEDSQSNYSGTN